MTDHFIGQEAPSTVPERQARGEDSNLAVSADSAASLVVPSAPTRSSSIPHSSSRPNPRVQRAANSRAPVAIRRTGVQRIRRTEYDKGDDEIDYGGTVNAARQGMTALKKDKKLRDKPSVLGKVLTTIPKGRIVKVVADPARSGKTSRSWAKVDVNLNGKKSSGYINTQDPTKDISIEDSELDGPIMDPAKGPQPEDVAQHMLGTCFLLGSLMSLARRRPDYVRDQLFAGNTKPTEEHDTYKVVFHRIKSNSHTYQMESTGKVDTVTVRATILTTSGKFVASNLSEMDAGYKIGSAGQWPWPAIVEKAFLAWPKRHDIDSAEGGQSSRASMYLTGEQYTKTTALTGSEASKPARVREVRLGNKKAIIEACAGDGIVAAATFQSAPKEWETANQVDGTGGSGGEPKVGGICFKHVYEVVDADDKFIRLRNPWGHYSRVKGKVEKDEAVSVLTWAEFWQVSGSDDVSLRTPVSDANQ